MKQTNIDAVVTMVCQYLVGELSQLEMQLDFPHEVGKRYRKMVAEDQEYAELIYDSLVEEGVNGGRDLSEEEFRKKIKEMYEDVIDIEKGGSFYAQIYPEYLPVCCRCGSCDAYRSLRD